MNRLIAVFKIRPGEERMAALLVSLMLVTAAGSAIGGNATEALFFARFGTEQLPTMYIILGLFTFVTSIAITAIMGRVAKQRLYVILPIILGLILIVERLVIPLNFRWFFAVIWLGMNVINILQSLLVWGLAGMACDTRQAKRLFPLFSAGGILGIVLGGLVTQPLAMWLHSENLLLIWAGALFITFALGQALIGTAATAQAISYQQQPSVIQEMQRGLKFVQHSKIMRWISYSAILFSVCFYSLALPFSRGAAAQFASADLLAGFLGQFQSLSTIAALLASLFLASRLITRFGIMPMMLMFPLIYLIGFAVLSVYAPFAILVAVRFAQMAYMNGIASTTWQTVFNVVPPEQRDQVRAFVEGGPSQAGTFIAGVILLIGEQALKPQQLYLIGFLAAALLVYIIWRAKQAYSKSLVEALRAGQPQVFISEEQPFGGPRSDPAAVSVVLRGLDDPDITVRRISVEIMGLMPVPEASSALVNALVDPDAFIRVAALKGLSRQWAASALLEISASLSDPDPEVRYQAIDALGLLAASPRGIVAHVEPLLADEDSLVRVQAALSLLRAANHNRARETLHGMAADANAQVRAQAIDALGKFGDESAYELVAAALDDSQPLVRKAASAAIVRINREAAVDLLIRHLDDNDSSVRQALAFSLGKAGEPALEPLVERLADPALEDGVLMALEHLPTDKFAPRLRMHSISSAQTALHYQRLATGISKQYQRDGALRGAMDGRLDLLTQSLAHMSKHIGLNALRALGLVAAREQVAVAVENLSSKHASQRANALETLESIGERDIVLPLLALWETGEAHPAPLPEDWLMQLLDDRHSWLRACAVLVAAKISDARLIEKLTTISCSDPDETVRAAAEHALLGGSVMETFTTLSLMERILFLRRVPLFADLSPADLKQVAAITNESTFSSGQVLARQGEIGSELFIVVSGDVRVMIASENQKDSREVATRRSGDYVGEMAVISQEPRIATLVANGDVRVLCLKQIQFEGILRERPEISLAMMRILCQRLKEASIQTL